MAGATEEVKIVLTAEERASREIERLQNRLTQFQSRMKTAFATPITNGFFDDKQIKRAFATYGKGMREVSEGHIRWAHDQRRLGKLNSDLWDEQTKKIQGYLTDKGKVRKVDRADFIEDMQRARAIQYVWGRQHEAFLQQKRKEQQITDQVERAKERLAGLGFTAEQRRRRESTREAEREERRKQALKNNSWALQMRQDEAGRKATARAEEAEAKRRQQLQNNSFAALMRQDAAARRRREAAEAQEARRIQTLKNNSWALQMRQEAQALRASERQQRDIQRDARRSASNAYGGVRSAAGSVRDAAQTTALVSAGTLYGIEKIVEHGINSRMRIESSEANLRMFGNFSQDQVAQTRRGWLDRTAVEKGFSPASALNAFTEVIKAGIPEASAKAVTQSIMGASAGLDLNVADTTKLVGRLSTLTQDPKNFQPDAISKMLNGIAVVAKVTAADSNEIVSSLRRGAGVLGSTKMSVQDLTAFTGVGISAGMQEGKAGTFMDFLTNDLVNAKNSRGQRRKDLALGAQMAGLGSLQSVSRQAAQDPTKLLLKLFENMAKMNPMKAGQIATLIGMREWRGEMLQMMKATPMLRQTVEAERDPANANHLQQAQDIQLGTMRGMLRQVNATAELLWEAIGAGFEQPFREISKFFVDFGKDFDPKLITDYVKVLTEGFVSGLGFNSIPEILEAIFGKPGDFNGNLLGKWFLFAKGLGQGIREVIDAIRRLIPESFDPKTIGVWAGEIIAFSTALTAIGPAISVLGSIASAVTALGAAVIATAAAWPLVSAFMGASGAAAGGGAGVAASIAAGATAAGAAAIPVSLVFISGAALAALATWASYKIGGPDGVKGGTIGIPSGNGGDSAGRAQMRSMAEEFGAAAGPRLRAPDGTPGHRQSFRDVDTTGSLGNLIHKASYRAFDDGDNGVQRIANSVDNLRSMIQLASLNGGGIGAAIGGAAGGGGGGGGGGRSGGGGRFFTPNNMQVPDWYGRGGRGGGGGGSAAALGVPNVGPMTADEKNKLGLILKYEGGYKNQMNYVGKSQGLDPNTAKGSTAQGYYQILNSNWRRLAPKLGIKTTNAMSSSLEEQTRVALALMRENPNKPGGGIQNWTNYNPRLRSALARGEVAPTGGVPNVASLDAGVGAGIAGLGGKGQYDGLRVKSGEAIAGGASALGITDLARQAQENLPGGVKHFSSFNDAFHHRLPYNSKHRSGLAFDTSLNDPRQHAAAAEAMRAKLRAAGLDESQFKVLDEYAKLSGAGTGGHIHTQFNDAAGAKKYHDYIAGLQAKTKAVVADVKSVGEKAKAAEGVNLSPGEKAAGVVSAGGIKGVPFGAKKPTTDEIVNRVPPGAGRGGGGGGGGRAGGNTYHIAQHINGVTNPQEVANAAQRKITEDWNHRTHDLEPELT